MLGEIIRVVLEVIAGVLVLGGAVVTLIREKVLRQKNEIIEGFTGQVEDERETIERLTRQVEDKRETIERLTRQIDHERATGRSDAMSAVDTALREEGFGDQPEVARLLIMANVWGHLRQKQEVVRYLDRLSSYLDSPQMRLSGSSGDSALRVLCAVLTESAHQGEAATMSSVAKAMGLVLARTTAVLLGDQQASEPRAYGGSLSLFQTLHTQFRAVLTSHTLSTPAKVECAKHLLARLAAAFPRENGVLELAGLVVDLARAGDTDSFLGSLSCTVETLAELQPHPASSVAALAERVFDLMEAHFASAQGLVAQWLRSLEELLPTPPSPVDAAWRPLRDRLSNTIEGHKVVHAGEPCILYPQRRSEYEFLTRTFAALDGHQWRKVDRAVLDRPAPSYVPAEGVQWRGEVPIAGGGPWDDGDHLIAVTFRNISPTGAWALVEGGAEGYWGLPVESWDVGAVVAIKFMPEGEERAEAFVRRGTERTGQRGLRMHFASLTDRQNDKIRELQRTHLCQ
jgi:hypothetical protein